MSEAVILYSEIEYKEVAASSTFTSTGSTPNNNEKIAVHSFRANGADPEAYVMLVWDWGGGAQSILASTKGDINIEFDTTLSQHQFTGDGTKKMQIVIVNDNTVETPFIGGEYEVVGL